MTEKAQAPSSFSFNKNDVTRAAKRRQRAQGWYRWCVKDKKNDVSVNGHIGMVLQVAPMKDPMDPATATAPYVRHQLTIPVVNPDHEGHVAPNTLGICNSFYNAIDPENTILMPRKEGGVLMFKGEEISKDEEEEARQECTEACLDRLKADYESDDSLIGQCFYGELYENKGFMNLKNLSAELPEGKELLDPAKWWSEDDAATDEAEEPKTNGAKASKPAASTKKPPAKKGKK